jgi:hypothetical protein
MAEQKQIFFDFADRLTAAENAVNNPLSQTHLVVDQVAWNWMLENIDKIREILRSNYIVHDRKSIFGLISCFFGYTEG